MYNIAQRLIYVSTQPINKWEEIKIANRYYHLNYLDIKLDTNLDVIILSDTNHQKYIYDYKNNRGFIVENDY